MYQYEPINIQTYKKHNGLKFHATRTFPDTKKYSVTNGFKEVAVEEDSSSSLLYGSSGVTLYWVRSRELSH